MKTTCCGIVLCLLMALPATAQQAGFQDPLLDRLVGNWVMRGTIAGDEITHDVVAEWVLGHNYLRFHDVAREKDEHGDPAYDATVFIDWDAASSRYACLWLDSTGGGGIASGVLGYATRRGDELPFVFELPDGTGIHNTFVYNRDADTWEWRIDNEQGGELSPFARVTLTRR